MRHYKSAAHVSQSIRTKTHIHVRTGCTHNDDHRTASGGGQHFAAQSPGRLRLHPCHTRSLHPISWQPSRACMCRIRDPALLYPGCRRTCCALKVRAASVSKMRKAFPAVRSPSLLCVVVACHAGAHFYMALCSTAHTCEQISSPS